MKRDKLTPRYGVRSLVTEAIYSSISRNISNVSSGLFLFGCIIEVGAAEYKKDISKIDTYRKSQDSKQPPHTRPSTISQQSLAIRK